MGRFAKTANISRQALLDELTKIGADAERRSSVAPALKSALVAGAGMAVGSGMAELAARKLPFFQPQGGVDPALFARRARAARIILPILGVSAGILGQKARDRMDQEYMKVRGFGEGPKK